VVDVFDRILCDPDGVVEYHYVLVDFLCRTDETAVSAGDDVSEVTLADPDDLARFQLTDKAQDVIGRGLALAQAVSRER
jgi:hypothetical protein